MTAPLRTEARARVLEALREAGADGVLVSDILLRKNVTNISAHLESLRFEGFGIAASPDRDARGWTDTKLLLTFDPERDASSRDGASEGGEPGSRLAVESPARDFLGTEPSLDEEDST